MRSFLFIVLWFCFLPRLSAQPPAAYSPQKPVDVLPPSPNAASLGKFGGIDLNLSSGVINQNIPLYTFNSINLSLPLSLSYTSLGVKVDEMAGNVGISWNLMAGGVITRTVLGLPDITSTHVEPPPPTAPDADYLVYLNNIANGATDAQPDLFSFSFNGYSGRFILDSAVHPFLLTYSNAKIDIFYVNGETRFKITMGDGIQYFFGGTDATEYSLTYQGGSGCSTAYPDAQATAFYLSSIVHPNGDTINFTYAKHTSRYITGITQGVYGIDRLNFVHRCTAGTQPAEPGYPNFSCPNTLEADIATLTGINSTSGAKVIFKHVGRRDISDSLVSGIEIYQPGKTHPFKSFSLNYEYAIAHDYTNSYTTDSSLFYRPFLMSFSENDSNNVAVKQYSLTYNDLGNLPPRLSFAQDDYGYFNGKNNGGLIPDPLDTVWKNHLPDASADRNPDTSYSFKGLLTKLTYPTGGSDTIVYEANTIYTHEIVYPPQTTAGAEALTDVSTSTATATTTFSVNITQTIQINASVSLRPGFIQQGGDNYAQIELTDQTTGETIFNNFVTLDITPTGQYIVSLVPQHSYLLYVLAGGNGLDASAYFQYQPGDTSSIYYNKVLFGGPRVAKVISRSEPSAPSIVKRYFYSQFTTSDAMGTPSLGRMIYAANYKKYIKAIASCTDASSTCYHSDYYFYSMFSSPLPGLYLHSANSISYSSVTESYGENFENGGVRHDFMITPDQPAYVSLGDAINGAPLDSYAWLNGKETYTLTFKPGGEQFIPVQEVFTHYKEDPRKNTITFSHIVNAKASIPCDVRFNVDNARDYFDHNINSLFQSWVYPDSVVTFTYDKNGVTRIADTVLTQYGNVSHAMPTSVSRSLSNGTREIQNLYYPDDLTLSGQPETARQALLNSHIVSPVLSKKVIRGGSQVYAQNTDYAVFGNGYALPRTYSTQIRNLSVQNMVELYKYDRYGKLLEQSKEMDLKQAYIWDYTNTYPIAQVSNADSASIAYTSFEADGSGGWTIGGGGRQPGGITGSLSYDPSSGTISRAGLTSGNVYILSYWRRNGSALSIVGTMSGYPIQGKTVIKDGISWTYFEHRITGQSSVSISTAGVIDELRLYPASAQMITFTYLPLIGMSSQCDVNNRITYYEYDEMARVKMVRDQDGNIVKTYDYHYQGQ